MPDAALLLTPGAGADRDQPALVAVEQALDIPVERMDFPYRKAGRRAPDRAPVLVAAVREGAAALAARTGLPPERLLLGGRSMGGRMCSMAVAEGLPALGLVLVSYPLHPPGKPDRLRVDHFGALDLPCLFVSGTKDAFGTPGELTRHAKAIPGPVTFAWIDGGDHGLRRRDAHVAEVVETWVTALLAG
ncbi:MAG TPA: alpha/beta family hydrolase [Acidimicrobiales bacterium]|nr:alpha/beta family hydrolase [Acidimicrobiales bacterium]